MDRTPHQILQTVDSARAVADQLLTRLSIVKDVMDLGDLAHIQTTVKKLEELLGSATEYEQILRDRVERTAARIAKLSVVGGAAASTGIAPTIRTSGLSS